MPRDLLFPLPVGLLVDQIGGMYVADMVYLDCKEPLKL